MKKRHSAEQIIRIIGEIKNSGLKVSDACRPHNISEHIQRDRFFVDKQS